jgi:sialic acid synthase SpsE/D-lyxose ketol-isomerase
MMRKSFDFKDLFVLDMANNHHGSLQHGREIIRAVANVAQKAGVRAALKFQFRQLDTFIHPSQQQGSEFGYVQRFLSTRLERDNYKMMLDDVRLQGLLAMCTPFDEESVELLVDMGFDVIKVASCSAKDWPLLEEVANAGKPAVVSTGGLTIEDIDNLVSFFQHRAVDFAIMHCVSIYPIPDERMVLRQIRALKDRYPGICVGWSTHESPADTAPVQMAVAFGADLFERHVGVETGEIKLNAYSSAPEQLAAWFEAHARAKMLCGPEERPPVSAAERDALDGLRRGVYAKSPIRKGTEIDRSQVYFAMPYMEGQVESGNWKPGIAAIRDVDADAPLEPAALEISNDPDVHVIKSAVHEVKAMLNEARIHLRIDFEVEYSHHYGLQNFRKTGAVMVGCINRDYCKKLVVQLPGQEHPSHYHARKEETFQVLHGVLHVKVGGRVRELHPGDTVLVQPGVWHSFWTETGVIFEEVSTTDYKDDSFYEDKWINRLERSERKTIVGNWGRFQLRTGGDERRGGVRVPGSLIRCVVFDFDGALVDSKEAPCGRAVSVCDKVVDAAEALSQLAKRDLRLFLTTGTPVEEILPMLTQRGLDHFFDGIYGGPSSKLDNLRDIAARVGARPEQLLFVGDGDSAAAAVFGCAFVEVAPGGKGGFEGESERRISDLLELPRIVDELDGRSP